ncbi:hypothetical protein NQ317_009783 [Molorchus minor]|uniref:Uncharacterized protein n=1 Tax=Molorchus minor TaxID=1323400 RepID=A0ABQ9ITP5_9CUCU|nr:hypothetical protein NQ317_009783 [Molorchus minor]
MAHVRAKAPPTLQTEEEVLDIVEDDPSTSTREIERQVNVSQHELLASVHRIRVRTLDSFDPSPAFIS